ncbi:MAG: hypothetical protein AABW45_00355 [Nanoarchaeota archaeon]
MPKKETTLFVITIILGFFLLIPEITKADFFNDVFNKITGFGSSPQSLSVAVQTNSLPIVGNVTIYNSPFSATESLNNSVFFSFIVTDGDGDNNIVNDSAVANISRGSGGTAETTRHNNTFIDNTLGGCRAQERGLNFKNFTCNISFVYYDGAGAWNISVRINDSTGAFAQNTSQTLTINELTALVIYPGSLSFPTVGLGDVNVSSRVNLTINNTGNDDISGREFSGEYINFTAITLVGETTATTVIPTSNFSIGTTDGLAQTAFCDVSRSANVTKLINFTINGSGAGPSPYNNFSGMINGSFMLAQATGAQEILQFCFLDVPDDLTAQNYSTTKSAAWSIIIW